MAYAARAHVTWMSVVIMVAVTTSCVTWLSVSRQKPRAVIIDGTLVPDVLLVPSSTAHCVYRVHNSAKDDRLAWEEDKCDEKFSLTENKTWINVEEQGVYLVYVQLTYSFKRETLEKGNSSSVDLMFLVEFNYTESKEEFIGAFDTREISTQKEHDAHLTGFFLLYMKPGNRLSILARPKERIKHDDVRPLSSYITIVRYADWSD